MAMLRVVVLVAFLAAQAASEQTILVTGATGRTGALLYNQLKGTPGVTVRGFVRNATKARELLHCDKCDASEGIFVGDVTKKETLTVAMEGATDLAVVTGAYPTCNPYPKCTFHKGAFPVDIDYHGNKNQMEAFAEASKKAGRLGHVAYVSTFGTTTPEENSSSGIGGFVHFYHLQAEAFLMSSGLPFTIVKPCGLWDKQTHQELVVGHDDEMFSHLEVATIHRADVARVMAGALLAPESQGAFLRFDLCGKPGAPSKVSDVLRAARYPWEQAVDGVTTVV